MRHGFVKAAAVTPDIKVADCIYNAAQICAKMREAALDGAKIIVFPELCLTGYTCGNLFWQETLLSSAKRELHQVIFASRELDALIFVGMPWERNGKLYDTAAVINRGRLIGLVPKTVLPDYADLYEARHFTQGNEKTDWVEFEGTPIPFGTNLLFVCREMEGLAVAAELGADLGSVNPPDVRHALAGASVIANLSAENESIGKSDYRRDLVKMQSARLLCGYIYAGAGEGESTTDAVFAGHNLIAENGILLKESARFCNETIMTELDIQKIRSERRRMTTFVTEGTENYEKIPFHLDLTDTSITRPVHSSPFVPSDKAEREKRCEEILTMQALGLKKRLVHTGCKSLVVGISGGLDSTLALIVMAKAVDMLALPRTSILAVTMPCFGTTDRTYQNACRLTKKLGAVLKEVNIKKAVSQHFEDIGHDPDKHDVTFENSQARERTQVIMDIANETGGMVIGTGDLSELALGWATYNGDHMSMYGVNGSIPKTLVRHLVRFYADQAKDEELKQVLYDVLDTPVSPELLPPKDGKIAQKTEDLVGPYELHDFFLYHVLRFGEEPAKIYRLACLAFEGIYEEEIILKWLKTFYHRFFSQQFKRSCLPDGPKVGSVAVSPRGDLRMPSDAAVRIWKMELEHL